MIKCGGILPRPAPIRQLKLLAAWPRSARSAFLVAPAPTSQFDPRIAVDRTTGSIAVSWYDCRADTSDKKTRFYAAVSRDAGTNFCANIQLEAGQSDATPPSYCPRQYFDYTELAYYGGFFYPAWADNSSSGSDGHMDIYIARVRY
jgi:hypothetical protein